MVIEVIDLPDFQVGDLVDKRSGYAFKSRVVAVFPKLDGEIRLVCESLLIPGMLHIFSPAQMRVVQKRV